ncbi:MAG: hypothetical protein ACOZNI_23550 [Myxococcota bacterium]
MRAKSHSFAIVVGVLAGVLLVAEEGLAGIEASKHNLANTSTNTVRATSTPDTASGTFTTEEVCVFCHFPHSGGSWPLWNRDLESDAFFTPINFSSLDFVDLEGTQYPDDDSKICLSCHSGGTGVGEVNALSDYEFDAGQEIGMVGTEADGTMPNGTSGAASGFTRRIGGDLTNDHPISLTYDTTLADTDGELRRPSANISMRCGTCHEPHTSDTDSVPRKFLRYNRFQVRTPVEGAFSESQDQICLMCHNKDRDTGTQSLDYSLSAHAHPSVADETYTAAASSLRQFASGETVWEVGCLNCHDTHTTEGARHLLREGVDEIATTAASTAKDGGDPAQEEVCYQCHTNSTESALSSVTYVPNIEDAFKLTRRMPITATDQPIDPATTEEVHDIEDADFTETQTKLGNGASTNRHVECTDCHNPHRVVKKRKFNDNPTSADAAGTHTHAATHDNIASGVLRGTTGVEPTWSSNSFHTAPSTFTLKKGDGGIGASSATSATWVTREYQVCLKCHSTYGYTSPPSLGSPYTGTTPSGTNSMTTYTDQAKEFNSPSSHANEPLSVGGDGGAYSVTFNTNNHRSWHPAVAATGRTNAKRGTSNTSFESPFNNGIGTQTMYCSDCHGDSTTGYTTTPDGGEDGDPWGPHGSTNAFILKGEWSSSTGASGREGSFTSNALCFKCHARTLYGDRNGGSTSGFGSLHAYHVDKLGKLRCSWCHVAVPHGWKNKAFLVNLNDVGSEGGLASGTQVRNRTTAVYNNGPYYNNAVLKVYSFAASGSWAASNCGSRGAPGNAQTGRSWMRDSDERCTGLP